MSTNYSSFYKHNDGFIGKRTSNISSIDKKLRGMLEKIRRERRDELLKDFRDDEVKTKIRRSNKKSKRKVNHSRFYREWKLSRLWSKELMEYSWLNFTTKGFWEGNFDEWLILALNYGRRCLLIHNNNHCELRDENGWKIFIVDQFPFKHSGLTIIDGIYNEKLNTYYCNDIIVWNNLNMCNSSTECRLYFLKSRIDEFSDNKHNEEMETNIENDMNSIIIRNLRIEQGKYYPVSKNNIKELYYNFLDKNKKLNFTHFVFVNKNSHYIKSENEFEESPYYSWYIWRDIEMKRRFEENNKDIVFQLKLNNYCELYTEDNVLIGKINQEPNVIDNLSLEDDQKVLLDENGHIFVNVKFEVINIVNFINFVILNNYRGLYNNHDKSHKNIFELSNISLQNKWIWNSNSIDYVIFHCVEFLIENSNILHNLPKIQYYLNLDSIMNSMF